MPPRLSERSPDGRDGALHADDVAWTLEPLPRIEFVDLTLLDAADVLVYARELQWDVESLRLLLQEACTALAQAQVRANRSPVRIELLLEDLRTARQTISDLRVQLARTGGGA